LPLTGEKGKGMQRGRMLVSPKKTKREKGGRLGKLPI